MAITRLDPNTALVVVDLEKGIVAHPTAHPIRQVIDCARRLAAAFRQHGLPVVLVNVAGGAPGRTEQNRQLGDLPEDWTPLFPSSTSARLTTP
ncbi:MAG: isochorismatase family protein [Rhodanobacter sp.]